MKYMILSLVFSSSLLAMEHERIEAHANGNTIVIDIESAPTELATRIAHARQLAPDESESDRTKLKIAGITAGSAAVTACTALCTAIITAGVTVAITYSQCNK